MFFNCTKIARPNNKPPAQKSSPIISQAMVHGDRRKFLSALVTVNEDTARRLVASAATPELRYADLVQQKAVREAVDLAIQTLNGALPSYETIKRYAILPSDFSQESGELTPTLKVKRKLVSERHKALLDSFYDEKLIE